MLQLTKLTAIYLHLLVVSLAKPNVRQHQPPLRQFNGDSRPLSDTSTLHSDARGYSIVFERPPNNRPRRCLECERHCPALCQRSSDFTIFTPTTTQSPPCQPQINFDRVRGANTLSEALQHFPDPIMHQTLVPETHLMLAAPEQQELNVSHDGSRGPAPGAPLPTQRTLNIAAAESCSGPQCQSCGAEVLKRIMTNANTTQRQQLQQEALSLRVDINTLNSTSYGECFLLSAMQQDEIIAESRAHLFQQAQQPMLQPSTNHAPTRIIETQQIEVNPNSVVGECTTIGTSYNIQRIQRGELLPDRSDFVSLCSMEWAWRDLGAGYTPKYVNELKCISDDRGCLAGYGGCQPRCSPMTVQRQLQNGVVEFITIQVATACECMVRPNSGIYSLVTRSRRQG